MNNLAPAILLSLTCTMPALASAEADDEEAAKAHFEDGVKLFKKGNYEGALVEFQAAYDAKPHFAVHYNIGQTYYKLHKYAKAVIELNAYLAEGGESVPKGKSKKAKQIIDELEEYVSSVKFVCEVEGATLYVDGEVMASCPINYPITMNVGEYEVEVRADGYECWIQDLSVAGGTPTLLEIELIPIVEAQPPSPVASGQDPGSGKPGRRKLKPGAFGAVLGVALASGIAASVTGGLFLKKKSEYESMSYEDDWRSLKDEMWTIGMVSNVLIAVAGTAAATAIILAIFTSFKKQEKDTQVSVLFAPDLVNPGLSLSMEF